MEDLVKILLDELRSRIDSIDHQLVHLLEERMQVVARISEIKAKNHLAVLDAGREKIVLEKIKNAIKDDEYETYLLEVFQGIMAASRAYQQQKISLGAAAENRGNENTDNVSINVNKFGLLGEKLGHSRSPEIHKHWFDYHQILGTYDLLERKITELPEFITFLKRENYSGLNVTIPYKTEMMKYLDAITPEAEHIGAVNTIKIGNQVIGHNTDYAGFGHLVESTVQTSVRKAAVLGTGGSSRAVIMWLLDHGAEELTLVSRDPDEASQKWIGLHTVDYNHFSGLGYDLIVNTTPVGMFPNDGHSPLTKEQLSGCLAVIDLIYNPKKTELMILAEKQSIPCKNGLLMLVAQAVEAQAFWQDIPYSQEVTDKIMQRME